MRRLDRFVVLGIVLLSGCFSVTHTVRTSPGSRWSASAAPPSITVPVVVTTELSSQREVAAGVFVLAVASDVVFGGRTWFRRGDPVAAEISFRDSAGGGKPGLIRIRPLAAMDVSGAWAPLVADEVVQRGKRRRGPAIGLGIGLTFVIGPFAWFFFGLDGREARLAAGTVFVATVRSFDGDSIGAPTAVSPSRSSSTPSTPPASNIVAPWP